MRAVCDDVQDGDIGGEIHLEFVLLKHHCLGSRSCFCFFIHCANDGTWCDTKILFVPKALHPAVHVNGYAAILDAVGFRIGEEECSFGDNDDFSGARVC